MLDVNELVSCSHCHPRLLVDFHFFTRFYHLCELNSRDDLIGGIIAHLDYTSCVPSWIQEAMQGLILSTETDTLVSFYQKLLPPVIWQVAGYNQSHRIADSETRAYSGFQHTRMFATRHLGKVIQDLGPAQWALELLVTQLYDVSPSVAEVAAQQLERACESLEVLQIVVNMQPTLDHLGDVGQPLLMRYVRRVTQ